MRVLPNTDWPLPPVLVEFSSEDCVKLVKFGKTVPQVLFLDPPEGWGPIVNLIRELERRGY